MRAAVLFGLVFATLSSGCNREYLVLRDDLLKAERIARVTPRVALPALRTDGSETEIVLHRITAIDREPGAPGMLRVQMKANGLAIGGGIVLSVGGVMLGFGLGNLHAHTQDRYDDTNDTAHILIGVAQIPLVVGGILTIAGAFRHADEVRSDDMRFAHVTNFDLLEEDLPVAPPPRLPPRPRAPALVPPLQLVPWPEQAPPHNPLAPRASPEDPLITPDALRPAN
jgi:hypothetical protein